MRWIGAEADCYHFLLLSDTIGIYFFWIDNILGKTPMFYAVI